MRSSTGVLANHLSKEHSVEKPGNETKDKLKNSSITSFFKADHQPLSAKEARKVDSEVATYVATSSGTRYSKF
jgi:hypothetical protein